MSFEIHYVKRIYFLNTILKKYTYLISLHKFTILKELLEKKTGINSF